jgi:hypothetical protein
MLGDRFIKTINQISLSNDRYILFEISCALWEAMTNGCNYLMTCISSFDK